MATASKPAEQLHELRIPFGAGYDTPTIVARGSAAQIEAFIIETFGFTEEYAKNKTVVELATEAALTVHALVNANTLGATPNPVAQNAIPEQAQEPAKTEEKKPASSGRRGIAGKSRKSIEKQIEEAKTEDELAQVYKANKDKITEEQLKLFSARKQAIQKGNN